MWPLIVRTKKAGDFIKTKIGTKKINRIFIDEKIPTSLRNTWPLLVNSKGDIIWVIGIQKADIDNFSNYTQFIHLEIIN